MLCMLIKTTFRKYWIFHSRFVRQTGSRATYGSCHLQLRVSQEIPPGGCRTTSIPQAVPLVMSRRLIRAVRNEGVLLPERAKIFFPISLFILTVGDQCSGMFFDAWSIFRYPSFSLSLFLGSSGGVALLFYLSLLLLLNHLHRRRRFIIASPNVMRHCHKRGLKIRHDLFGTQLSSAINYALEKRPTLQRHSVMNRRAAVDSDIF